MTSPEQIAAWLREQLDAAGMDGFACGLSGGIDSALTAALAVRAVGPGCVLAALMPCQSQPEDATLGQLVADTFGITTVTVELGAAFDALVAQFPPDVLSGGLAIANVKPACECSHSTTWRNRTTIWYWDQATKPSLQ